MILLNLNIISTHFPLERGSAPHSQSAYISPEIPVTTIFWFAQTLLERQGQRRRTSHIILVHHVGHNELNPYNQHQVLHPLPGQPAPDAKPLAPVRAGFANRRPQRCTQLLFAPLGRCVQHVLLLCTLPCQDLLPTSPLILSLLYWRSSIGPTGKIPLGFSFPHSNGKREFYFSRSSLHIINELKQHLLSGTPHQKKQFSSFLKTNDKAWVFQRVCCLWNTQILAIAQCKLKADLAKGRWDQFVDFLEQISKCIWTIR